MVVVAGDVDPQQVRALAEKHYGALPVQALPERKPQQEPVQKGLRRLLQTMGHRFARTKLATPHHLAQFFQGLGPDLHVLADDESFDLEAIDQYERRGRHGQWLAIVARNHPADRNTGKGVGAQHDGIEHHATDVLKMAIDAIWAS